MDPASATLIAGAATAGSGLLQGILQMESDKRRLAMERKQFEIQQKENRFAQELAARNQIAEQPLQNANYNTAILQNLISALGGTR